MNFITKKWFAALLSILISACSPNDNKFSALSNFDDNISQSKIEEPRKITILYTNDEHGWIEKTRYSNGAANIMGLWRDQEGYDGHESYLLLSGGDNSLGPPISNLFKGESVVDVMNTMEYDASAIGNHEFEFGVSNLYNRIEQANFHYLSANIRKKITNEVPVFATPYIIKEINDVMVGIIGLSTISTPNTTVPEYVKDYEFIDYLVALQEIVPHVKVEGAELLIVVAHICYSELFDMAPNLIDMGISVIGGGHCHREMKPQVISNSNGKVAVIQADPYLEKYAKAEISFDIIGKEIISINVSSHHNKEENPDQYVENAICYWRDQADSLDLEGNIK
jgi:2',3'-cyclic-nucleotide 2'-phosphodiesterase (5'-nucleotidase family)